MPWIYDTFYMNDPMFNPRGPVFPAPEIDPAETAPYGNRVYGGRRIDTGKRPHGKQLNRTKRLGAIFCSSPHIVQEPLRDLIEEMDPGRQQFWPFDVLMLPGDVPFPVPCYGLNIAVRYDTVIEEKSRLRQDGSFLMPVFDFKAPEERHYTIVLDRAKREGAHMWLEERLYAELLVSDELVDAMEARGLPFFPDREYVKEI